MESKLHVPDNLENPATLAKLLPAAGLELPPAAMLAAGMGKSLSACGKRFSIAEVDAALAKHDLTPQERMHVKSAMGMHGLLAA
jgi:hypothetical protein